MLNLKLYYLDKRRSVSVPLMLYMNHLVSVCACIYGQCACIYGI